MFLGSKGIDITQLSKNLEPIATVKAAPSSAFDQTDTGLGIESDIELYLKSERSNAICAIAELSMKNVSKLNE